MSLCTSDRAAIQRIVLCFPAEPHHLSQLRAAVDHSRQDPSSWLDHDVEIVDAGQERVDELLPSADIFIGHAKVPVRWDRVLASGRLRWIQSSAAGLDHCLVPGVIADDRIIVSSAAGLFAPQVAEQTFALLMGCLRRLHLFDLARPRREFVRLPTDDLRGKTVGIVGLGGNGREIARTLAPWDVRIIATDVYPIQKPAWVDQLWPADQLEKLLAQSDVVVLAIPLNRSTHHLISSKQFAAMKPGAYLVNVARGQVVDEVAMVAALQSGRFSGVGLDVTEIEPLPPASPLWDDPRVLITPHVGAQSARRVDDSTELACENIRRFFKDEPIINRVDKTLGFPHPNDSWSALQRPHDAEGPR